MPKKDGKEDYHKKAIESLIFSQIITKNLKHECAHIERKKSTCST